MKDKIFEEWGMNPKIFKAYDIRGKYPDEINEEIVYKIISSLISRFKIQDSRFKIIVGRDSRLSSPSLYKAVLKAFNNSALNANRYTLYPVGMITTPMFYFLINYFKADGGIMITASHNPKKYNGMKIAGKNAVPISGYEIYKNLR